MNEERRSVRMESAETMHGIFGKDVQQTQHQKQFTDFYAKMTHLLHKLHTAKLEEGKAVYAEISKLSKTADQSAWYDAMSSEERLFTSFLIRKLFVERDRIVQNAKQVAELKRKISKLENQLANQGKLNRKERKSRVSQRLEQHHLEQEMNNSMIMGIVKHIGSDKTKKGRPQDIVGWHYKGRDNKEHLVVLTVTDPQIGNIRVTKREVKVDGKVRFKDTSVETAFHFKNGSDLLLVRIGDSTKQQYELYINGISFDMLHEKYLKLKAIPE